jgi:hypothetical protein
MVSVAPATIAIFNNVVLPQVNRTGKAPPTLPPTQFEHERRNTTRVRQIAQVAGTALTEADMPHAVPLFRLCQSSDTRRIVVRSKAKAVLAVRLSP